MLRDRIGDVLAKQKKNEDINDWLLQFSQSVSQCSFRIFVTKMVSNNQETL